MNPRNQIQLSLNGAVILLIGMIMGVPYAFALNGSWGDEATRAWHVAHTGVAALGVTLLAVAGILNQLLLRDRLATLLVWSMSVAGYGFVIGLTIVAVTGVRGLQPIDGLLNWIAFSVDGVAMLAAFLGIGLVIQGAFAALRRQ